MIAKCPCEHCGVNIEFATEEFLSGSSVKCPECGKETTLYISPQTKPEPKVESTNESQSSPTPPAPYANSSKNLRICADCGHQVSKHADACPHCGASFKKRHGVFFYVFWGVVSLIITGFILSIVAFVFFGGLASFMNGFEQARQRAQEIQQRQQETNTIAVTNQSSAAVADESNEKSDYINKSLVLYDFKAGYENTELDGRVACVGFKIKNNGDRTLKEIDVTVYFKDASGTTISEEKVYPVLVTEFGTDNEPLKPGYIWQNANSDGYSYEAKKVPSEWQEGNADAKITDIEFAD